MIVSGDLAPGAAISDKHLAARLGVSRTPVREALRQLADEGLVVVWPRAATRIAPVDHDALPAIYDLIGALLAVAITHGAAMLPTVAGDLKKLRANGGLEHQYRLAGLLAESAQIPLLARALSAPASHARRAETLLGSDVPAQVRRAPEFARLRDACMAPNADTAAGLAVQALQRRGALMQTAWAARNAGEI
jgi:DNA-binding GntR family transcriptional regulator